MSKEIIRETLRLLSQYGRAEPSERAELSRLIQAGLETAEDSFRSSIIEALAELDREEGDSQARFESEVHSLHAAFLESQELMRPSAIPSVGDQIGPYRLIELIGRGGMGRVFRAEQKEPVERVVALKIVAADIESSAEIRARFEAERQALALMNHPNIARVFDGGTTPEGRPYFAMELVPGLPLTEYCDRHCLSIRERLRVFEAICLGVQHAHQKGIIHRDLKPSNLLVVLEDDRPVPKIIDFGVARAIGRRLTDKTLHTLQGQIVGTLGYMSPEQADRDRADIDTRSDVYSLGVVLYELLAGHLPYSGGSRSPDPELLWQAIRESDPSKPSVALASLGERATGIAAERHTDARSLIRSLHGDLDWIVLRALEKDRSRRYASAAAFAEDIARHLSDQAVLAGPPSAVYRFKKLLRRHRASVVTAALVLVSLIGGFLTTLHYYFEADAAADDARREERLKTRALKKAEESARAALLEQARTADALREKEAAFELAVKNEDAAKRSALRAEARLHEVLQLSNIERLQRARQEADASLWPLRSETEPLMKAWIGEVESEVLPWLAPLEDSLAALEAEALPYTEEMEKADVERHPDGATLLEERERLAELRELSRESASGAALLIAGGRAELEQRRLAVDRQLARVARLERAVRMLRFEEEPGITASQKAWRYRQLQSLVQDLRDFSEGPKERDESLKGFVADAYGSSLPEVRRRLDLVGQLEQMTLTSERAGKLWRFAARAIKEHPRYGFDLVPQFGLLPLGPDPVTGWWEFAVRLTGSVPVRGRDGQLALDGDSAVILVLLPSGQLDMGAVRPDLDHPFGTPGVDPSAAEDESPICSIRLEPFFLSKYEMSQGQWYRARGDRPSFFGEDAYGPEWSEYPVEQVSWRECREVLSRLGLGLPTEAQWEYATRAGTSSIWWTGNDEESLTAAANFYRPRIAREDDGPSSRILPVGSLQANPFGLFDVHGNVWEWCRDGYLSYTVAPRPGDGLRTGERARYRVSRGGSFTHNAGSARSAERGSSLPDYRNVYLGVRPARRLDR
ncbi:MAG: SUMF1/EgtB/PvdO family nonheme iron enzyme [Planctomycetota bacterium]